MFLFLSWTCFSLPATFSLVGATLAANRHSMGVGIQSVIKRLPIMVAPIVGGILIDRFGILTGVRIGLIVSIFLSAATILVQRQLRETAAPALDVRQLCHAVVCLYDPRTERIRRYFTEGFDHWLLRAGATRPNDRGLLSRPRSPCQRSRNRRRLPLETGAGDKLSRGRRLR